MPAGGHGADGQPRSAFLEAPHTLHLVVQRTARLSDGSSWADLLHATGSLIMFIIMSHFFAHVFRLRYIQRWPLMRNAVPEDTAQHSYHVAVLTHALCTIGREVFGREVDAGQAVILALFHD